MSVIYNDRNRLIRTAELQNPTSHLAKVKALAKNLDTWFESLDAPTKGGASEPVRIRKVQSGQCKV